MALKTLTPQDVDPKRPTPVDAPPPPALTAEQIAIVKSTAPVLQQHGVTITTLFYNNMLAAHPELKNIFSATSQATGAQPRALAASVLAYATYVDDLGKLQHAVERIAHKHASLQIQPAQYAIVGKHLMEAIGSVLGAAATPPIVDAWTTAYGVLAGVFIGREQTLYDEARARDGGRGWVGWRPFRVARRAFASDAHEILNLYLEPVDGRPLPSYEPGQYVSLQLPVPDLGGVLQSRQYSLSAAPRTAGDYYRISVRRDDGDGGKTTPGRISNLVHALQEGDAVELSQPQGEFVVAAGEDPLVLISAGVGATPVLSILDSVPAGRRVSWLHASHSRATLPFAGDVAAIQRAHPGTVHSFVVLTEKAEADAEADSAVRSGTHLQLATLPADEQARLLFTAEPHTGYYVCGPAAFMLDVRTALESLGVDRARIHLELFDTGDL